MSISTLIAKLKSMHGRMSGPLATECQEAIDLARKIQRQAPESVTLAICSRADNNVVRHRFPTYPGLDGDPQDEYDHGPKS